MKSHVSMESKQCFICYTVFDSGTIFLKKDLRPTLEEHTVTGYGTCDACKLKIQEGFVALIGTETDETQTNDPKRSGEVAWVKEHVFTKVFDLPLPKKHVAFAAADVIETLRRMMPKESSDGSKRSDENDTAAST